MSRGTTGAGPGPDEPYEGEEPAVAVSTRDTVLLGFGLEQIADPLARSRVLDELEPGVGRAGPAPSAPPDRAPDRAPRVIGRTPGPGIRASQAPRVPAPPG